MNRTAPIPFDPDALGHGQGQVMARPAAPPSAPPLSDLLAAQPAPEQAAPEDLKGTSKPLDNRAKWQLSDLAAKTYQHLSQAGQIPAGEKLEAFRQRVSLEACGRRISHDHNPPWQWGCRCRKVPLLPEEVDEIKDEDKKRLPEDRRVLEGPALDKARNGQLDAGPAKQMDIRSDRMRGKPDGYHFDPSALTIPVTQLKERYDPATWDEFEAQAKAQEIQPGLSVWSWLNGSKPKTQKASKNKGKAATPAQPAQPAKAAAPSQPATKPAGTPLKGKLDSRKITKAEQQRVSNVLAIIDRVHGDGPLKPIPVGNKPGNALGAFRCYKGGPALDINYKKPSSKPKKNTEQHAELTLVHEVGHWLDYSGKGKNQFSSDNLSGDMAGWWQAVQKSTAWKGLQSLPSIGQRDYYTSSEETFARAYAQFIAEESGDTTLLQQVKDIRSGVLPDRHWEEADFAPIREEMRNLFIVWGWMKANNNTP